MFIRRNSFFLSSQAPFLKNETIKVFYRVIRNTMSSSSPIKCDIVAPSSGKHTGTVIFLHGSGGTGELSKEWVGMLRKDAASFPHLKIIYPTAPLQPYTPLNGELSNVWFDRLKITPNCPEVVKSIDSMAENIIDNIIKEETKAGIPLDRIVIGGFSMGGAMALHLGYRFLPEIAGVFVLSSFANDNSLVYKTLQERQDKSSKLPFLFHAHGDKDDLVDFSWGQATFSQLQQLGITGVFYTLPNAFHELKRRELDLLFDWINKIVPNN